jgi:hypothetical protein
MSFLLRNSILCVFKKAASTKGLSDSFDPPGRAQVEVS